MLKLRVNDILTNISGLEGVMPNQLLVFDCDEPQMPDMQDLQKTVDLARERSRQVAVFIEETRFREALTSPVFLKLLEQGRLTQIHLKLQLNIANYNYLGVGHQSPEIVSRVWELKHLRERFPNVEVVLCLASYPDQIHHLGPLIAQFPEGMLRQVFLLPPARRTESAVKAYRSLFEYLRMRGLKNTWITFHPFSADRAVWNIQTFNSFSGPETVHFDISNKCTHSCNFCGLYGNEAVAFVRQSNAENREYVRRMMSATLDFEKGKAVLETLPDNVRSIQFGGVGDPCTHPNFLDFVRTARERAIDCEILSNMDYFDEDDIIELSRLGSNRWHNLHFIANVSGSSEEMFLRTRPRQNKKNFENVVRTLKRFTEERNKRGGHGVYFTMMCVMNKTNYMDAENYVRFSHELGATRVFLKPMEVHIEHQTAFLIPPELEADYNRHIRNALNTADRLGIEVIDRGMLNKIAEADRAREMDCAR